MKIEKVDNIEWPEESEAVKKARYTRAQNFVLGEFNSSWCEKKGHSNCYGLKRTWYGPVVTPSYPVDTFYDVPCDCSCHDDEHYKPRLRRLIGPRPKGEHKPGCFEPRGEEKDLPRHC